MLALNLLITVLSQAVSETNGRMTNSLKAAKFASNIIWFVVYM